MVPNSLHARQWLLSLLATAGALLLAISWGASEAADVGWTWRHQKFDYQDLSGTQKIWVSGTEYEYRRDFGGAEKRLNQNLGGYVGTRVVKTIKSKTATRATMDLWLDATTSRTSATVTDWQSLHVRDGSVVAKGEGTWMHNCINSRPAMVFSSAAGLTVSGRTDAAELSVFLAGKFDRDPPYGGTLIRLGSSIQPWSIEVKDIQFVAKSGNSTIASLDVPSGVWVVALRISGDTGTLYVNDASKTGKISARGSSSAKATLTLADKLPGLNLGEVRLFRRALPNDPNDPDEYQNFIFQEMRSTWGAR